MNVSRARSRARAAIPVYPNARLRHVPHRFSTPMKLSTLTILLGLIVCAPQVYGLLKPQSFAAAARSFPRSLLWGWLMTVGGTLWFLSNVNAESISDFAAIKNYMLMFFAAAGLATCIFVRDFLAVRGLAVVLLLLAKTMVDTARWADTEWRLVIAAWAYLLVIVGMWLTVSPWRLRDFIDWSTATPGRTKAFCAVRLAFGLFVVGLGLTAFRAAEARAAALAEIRPAGAGQISLAENRSADLRPGSAAIPAGQRAGVRGRLAPVR